MIADSFKMHIPNCKVTGAEYAVDFIKDGERVMAVDRFIGALV